MKRRGLEVMLWWPSGQAFLGDHHGPHHIVLFVLQDVAVPDILVADGQGTGDILPACRC
jgi:hypothetical protein